MAAHRAIVIQIEGASYRLRAHADLIDGDGTHHKDRAVVKKDAHDRTVCSNSNQVNNPNMVGNATALQKVDLTASSCVHTCHINTETNHLPAIEVRKVMPKNVTFGER